ncbi:MAG: anaerobic ribonucleoside-triphosphate reductase activating protein [Clostridia bacterium]|nr:anaerobic ribonucleoside-triphosphate reductase activating protein [Clostridia bacterium]
MEIFGMEKLSLVDYDGYVSATVFTGSCNFRCGFCHNSPLVLDYNNLQTLPEDEVLSYLKKRKGILEGLCITGGEPTLSRDLPEFCEKVKEIGYKVKLDTNGTNLPMVKTLIEHGLIDYIAMDIKNDLESYGDIIGIKNYNTEKVKNSVDFLLSNTFPYEFRTTLIKEYHTAENIEKIGQWIKGARAYFMQKFKDGENCISAGLTPIDEKTAIEFSDIAKKYVQKVKLRGYDL